MYIIVCACVFAHIHVCIYTWMYDKWDVFFPSFVFSYWLITLHDKAVSLFTFMLVMLLNLCVSYNDFPIDYLGFPR